MRKNKNHPRFVDKVKVNVSGRGTLWVDVKELHREEIEKLILERVAHYLEVKAGKS